MLNNLTWTTVKRKYKDFVPATYNPRKISEKKNEDLKNSLEKFGVVEIPVINLNDMLIAGHQRVRLSLQVYGMDYEDDVRIPNRPLTEEEAKELNIRSNANTGEWDWEKINEEFDKEDLTSWGLDIIDYHDNNDMEDSDFEEFKDIVDSDEFYGLNIKFEDKNVYDAFLANNNITLNNNFKRVGKVISIQYPQEERRDVKNLKFD